MLAQKKTGTLCCDRCLISIAMLATSLLLVSCGESPDSVPSASENTSTNSDTSSGSTGNGSLLGGTNSQTTPGESVETAIGLVLVYGDSNRTLYTFADDTNGVSNCTGSCASVWPPLPASSGDSASDQFTTLRRADGSLQWAFKNRPLYYYEGDAAKGEVNGERISGKWFVARPDPFTVVQKTGYANGILAGRGSINGGIDDPAIRRSDIDGLTLYTYARDISNTSRCNAGCAEDWPPLYADRGSIGSDGYTVITRDDGAPQWSYNGSPLYFYVGDSEPGEITGEGVETLWFVAFPL